MKHTRTLVALWSIGTVAAISLTGRTSNGEAAPLRQVSPNWALSAPVFPAAAKVHRWQPATNADMQPVFGRFHSSSYDALHRLNDRGYLQIEQWTKMTTSQGKRYGHLLTWSYGISEFGNEAEAMNAVNDLIPQMSVVSAGGPYGRTDSFIQGGYTYLYLTFGERTLTGEVLCSVKTRDAKSYKATLQRTCRAHVAALMPTLSNAAIPTATPTPTATATSSPTNTPTPSATSTPTPTSTSTSTPTFMLHEHGVPGSHMLLGRFMGRSRSPYGRVIGRPSPR